MPIIVSRVAPNTPADLCIPRLNEGDQVLYINGRDVSSHTHEQVREKKGRYNKGPYGTQNLYQFGSGHILRIIESTHGKDL